MAKVNSDSNKVRLNITLDKELQDRMISVCQKEERSMSSLISLAVKQYISNKERGAN